MTSEVELRLAKVEELMLRGWTSPLRISEILGGARPIPRQIVGKYMDRIRERWAEQGGPKRLVKRRAARIRQLESLLREAVDGFDRSKLNATEVVKTSKLVKCDVCRGTRGNGALCGACGGTGRTIAEETTQRVKGQAGDPAFLSVATAAIREIARLEGLEPEKRVTRKVIGRVLHAHLHQQIAENPYANAPTAAIIEAKLALARLRESAGTESAADGGNGRANATLAIDDTRDDANPKE